MRKTRPQILFPPTLFSANPSTMGIIMVVNGMLSMTADASPDTHTMSTMDTVNWNSAGTDSMAVSTSSPIDLYFRIFFKKKSSASATTVFHAPVVKRCCCCDKYCCSYFFSFLLLLLLLLLLIIFFKATACHAPDVLTVAVIFRSCCCSCNK